MHNDKLPVDTHRPNPQPVPKGAMKTEPAVSVGGSISAVLVALFAVLRASGVGVTEELSEGVTALVLALCAIPAVSGFLTRFFVYPESSVQRIANEVSVTGDATIAPPPGKK